MQMGYDVRVGKEFNDFYDVTRDGAVFGVQWKERLACIGINSTGYVPQKSCVKPRTTYRSTLRS